MNVSERIRRPHTVSKQRKNADSKHGSSRLISLINEGKKRGHAILGLGITQLEIIREKLAVDPSEARKSSVVREGSEAGMDTREQLHEGELPSGNYTKDTLPPLSTAVQEILSRARAGAEELAHARAETGEQSAGSTINLVDRKKGNLGLADKPKSGITIK